MNIACYRCGKEIDSPNEDNADYIIAEDTKVDELREVFIALKHTPETLAKLSKGETIRDEDYDVTEIVSPVEAKDVVKIKTEDRLKSIQKTGVICPDCYKDTDTVIWGVHKARVAELEKDDVPDYGTRQSQEANK